MSRSMSDRLQRGGHRSTRAVAIRCGHDEREGRCADDVRSGLAGTPLAAFVIEIAMSMATTTATDRMRWLLTSAVLADLERRPPTPLP